MAALPPFPWLPRRDPGAWCRTALGRDVSLQGAVDQVARQLAGCGPADLALVFAAADYASDLPRLMPLLRQKLHANKWLGCCGAGVVGTAAGEVPHEIERQPALSVMLLRLPGVRLHPFSIDTGELPDLDGPAEAWHAAVGVSPNMANSMLLLVDPTSEGINDLISGLDYAYPQTIKLGGIAGQHSAPHGSLLLDDGVRSGAIGCLIGGAWRLDPVLAQGCRPIGPVMEVEQAQRNVVLQVSSEGQRQRSPVEALQAILTHLSPKEREQVRHSLFLGVGRNDFSLSPTLVEPSTFWCAICWGLIRAMGRSRWLSACGSARKCSSNCGMLPPPATKPANCWPAKPIVRPPPWRPCCLPAWAGARVSTERPMAMWASAAQPSPSCR